MSNSEWSRRLAAAVGVGLLAGCASGPRATTATATDRREAATAADRREAATEAPAAVRRAIVTLLSTQTAAWNRGDVAGFMQGYWPSDSLVFIGKSGPTYGYQATLNNYRRNYPSPAAMGQLDFGNLRVTPLAPGAAQVVGRWHLARPAAGDLQGHFLLVLRKINGQWVIVADHSS